MAHFEVPDLDVFDLPPAFMPEGPLGINNMPLADKIPYTRYVGDISTAAHEHNHAHIALEKGLDVTLSVIPRGDTLGWTQIHGYCSLNDVMTMQAAGAVHTGLTKAEGFGFDQAMVYANALSQQENPFSAFDNHKNEAQNLLSGLSTRFRRKVAEMITYLGTVSTPTLRLIYQRAHFEIQWENNKLGDKLHIFFQTRKNPLPAQPQYEKNADLEIPNTDECTTIIEEKDRIVWTYWAEGEKQEEVSILKCPMCHGEGGHLPGCDANTNLIDVIIGKDPSRHDFKLQNPLNFSKSDIIFSRN